MGCALQRHQAKGKANALKARADHKVLPQTSLLYFFKLMMEVHYNPNATMPSLVSFLFN